MKTLALVAASIGVALLGCGDDPLVCAEGTVEQGGVCVAEGDAVSCGPGTSLIGGECVADEADVPGSDPGGPPDDADVPGGEDGQDPGGPPEVADEGPEAEALDADAEPDGPGDASDLPPPSDVDPFADEGCFPQCVGKDCGDDGCGGSCGTCEAIDAPFCSPAGQCVATCVPDCVGKNCGDDGCGGTCGECGEGEPCNDFIGRCVDEDWSCNPLWYEAADTCDCDCGAWDPDCDDPFSPLAGCDLGEMCSPEGACVPEVPAGWTCAPQLYDDLAECDCGCGVPDPDCDFDQLPVVGCLGEDPVCNPDGTCAPCVADCEGKVCGSNGCGGVCGICSEGVETLCAEGQCINPCSPEPYACLTAECGDDGCGGSCGFCGANAECVAGHCQDIGVIGDPASCLGHCGSVADAGCYCTPQCVVDGNCCADYEEFCVCQPDCTDKVCGDDGCGGSCGTCGPDAPYCDEGVCLDTCEPQCKGKTCGDDGCGGVCGTCAEGETCSFIDQCVPAEWKCEPYFYHDQLGCDCGCGAVDPDCEEGAPVYNCPDGAECGGDGLCAVDFCHAQGDCSASWCMGTYYEGEGKYAGVCETPVPDGDSFGAPCTFGAQCASLTCVEDLCRQYCLSDADCPEPQDCVALPVKDPVWGDTIGFAPVCDLVPGSAEDCTSQADCAAESEECQVHVDPVDLGPRFLCGPSSIESVGESCAAFECPDGHFCDINSYVCTVACPAGDVDCPDGWTCGSAPLHNNGTDDPSDDPEVPVCVQ